MTQGVYGIRCLANGRIYVGSARKIKDRWRHHCWALQRQRHGNRHLQAAWLKYEESSFEFIVLEEVSDVEQLVVREQAWLDQFPNKFNIRIRAESNRGFRHSLEWRRRAKGRKHSLETRLRLSELKTGLSLSEETKGKIRQAKIGTKMSEAARGKMSDSRFGKLCPWAKEQQVALTARKMKRYLIRSPDGEQFEIVNMRQFCRESGLCQSGLTAVARGKRSSYKAG
ncbi:GIY-YIG nuclease family protein [Bradyrhizobium sp. 179]|uniref:GIY-YIG nuclease family protein n=1 Tax=Bradyrhizobium sp. 179 TaxID=2782648 RepID=UPI001FF7A341|nr:GIY-YIG nuclease family protein [Bradyrhizobium sp. 179]MCK1543280.1 GIY-YIG nuclease family protein [Bradyrhizobium sp. 179]